ncbi:MAG TPA: MFS transporter [Tepidisphaeraceae bacterium]|jgi:OPA family glycerol-3-phosphate transporter-like MFS transporter/OPA family sugar phosphate sensor protein UhpC-like MFS transporter|nr:MFS transporter [Tepidisphaeraceae bacterium]
MMPTTESSSSSDTEVNLPPAFQYWQRRILLGSTFGYAIFYFVRKNLPVAMPGLSHDLGIGKAELGLFLTLHGVLYGISKFLNGFIGDRVNARYFMALGLLLSALVNFAFGASSTVFLLGTLWLCNGWFQGMGFPPCARLLTHWFTPRQLPMKMSLWNTSHSLGAAGIVILCGYLAVYNWRLCFYVPGGIALVTAIFLLFMLRDTPESLGMPSIEEVDPDRSPGQITQSETEAAKPSFRKTLVEYVFSNPYIWLISLANFFVYVVRYGMLDWGPTFLKESKGIQLSTGGWMVAAFELSGATGAIFAGYLTKRFFAGRGGRASIFYMIGSTVSILALWKLPAHSPFLGTLILCAAGFLIYGPQCLIGVAAANLATKRAAASAVGLTGIFGYASTVLSGWGIGLVAERYGWNAVFVSMIAAAACGTICFVMTWHAPSHTRS